MLKGFAFQQLKLVLSEKHLPTEHLKLGSLLNARNTLCKENLVYLVSKHLAKPKFLYNQGDRNLKRNCPSKGYLIRVFNKQNSAGRLGINWCLSIALAQHLSLSSAPSAYELCRDVRHRCALGARCLQGNSREKSRFSWERKKEGKNKNNPKPLG